MSKPKTVLPIIEITSNMGWSDDSDDIAYNTCITTPHPFSHEKLWREDNVYDLFITTSHNTDPIIPECGSAIFIHQMNEAMTPTAGCLALKFEDLLNLVETATLDTYWVVGDDLGYVHSA
jgi:L,D-peptidoglycan transpeptidase YkuD (ErfK/YbiS/YcfS/YnhG family)